MSEVSPSESTISFSDSITLSLFDSVATNYDSGAKSFKATHAAQLNNAEWAPIFIICHLYLHLKGAGSRYSAGASVAGCWAFIACKAFLFQGKPAPVAATLRYVALLWLIIEVAQTEM